MDLIRRFVPAILLLVASGSPALASDAEVCFDDLVLLRQEPAAVTQACEALARQGDPKAQNQLGVMHAEGWLLPKDEAAAVDWYHKAARQGFAVAQANLAFMYLWGLGVPRDYEQAYIWATLAADSGNVRAARLLSAVLGHLRVPELADAQLRLGEMYAAGIDVPKDAVAAGSWFRKAAGDGLAAAQTRLAQSYIAGIGVPQDDGKAYYWLSLAADSGDRNAAALRAAVRSRLSREQIAAQQVDLAQIYIEGRMLPLVPQDPIKAQKLLQQAAEQGYARAQVKLGNMYWCGSGIAQDKVKAYVWFVIAARGGNDEAAAARSILASDLTSDQVTAGELLARAGTP
jgi:TPR repeat protein